MSANGDGDFWSMYLFTKYQGKNVLRVIGFFIVLFIIQKIFSNKYVIMGIFIALGCAIVGTILYLILSHKNRKTKKISKKICDLVDDKSYTLAIGVAEDPKNKDFINATAHFYIGTLYYKGDGCDIDRKKAFEHFKAGSDNDDSAKTHYAIMLLLGECCEEDVELGKKLLIEASEKGEFAALLVDLYTLRGDYGFTKDVATAMKNLRLKIDNGSSYAKLFLGQAQYEGYEGVKQDKEKGLSLITESANEGCLDAQNYLNNLSSKNKTE